MKSSFKRRQSRLPRWYNGSYVVLENLEPEAEEYKCPNCKFSRDVDIEARRCFCKALNRPVEGKIVGCEKFRSRIPSMFAVV